MRLSVDEYLALRRSTGAIKPSLDLIMLPLEISDEYLELDNVKELEIMAIDLIAIANVSLSTPGTFVIAEHCPGRCFFQRRASQRGYSQYYHCPHGKTKAIYSRGDGFCGQLVSKEVIKFYFTNERSGRITGRRKRHAEELEDLHQGIGELGYCKL